jgi:hypothetical protein
MTGSKYLIAEICIWSPLAIGAPGRNFDEPTGLLCSGGMP